jgi:hypothetical protein
MFPHPFLPFFSSIISISLSPEPRKRWLKDMVAAQAPTGWIPTLIYMFSSISQINIFETIAAPFDKTLPQ